MKKRYGSKFKSQVALEAIRGDRTRMFSKNNIKISMDGKGRCLDNAKMERFWWSLKYESIYLHRL